MHKNIIMAFPLLNNVSKKTSIILFFVLFVFGYIFSSLLAVLITGMLSGYVSELNILRVVQICGQLFMFIIPALSYVSLVKKYPAKALGFNRMPLYGCIGVLMIFFIVPINDLLLKWNESITLPESLRNVEYFFKEMQKVAEETTDIMLNVDTIGGLILNIIMVAVLAAVGEELVFRSLIQPFMIRSFKNAHLGIFFTAVLFSAFHFEFYGFLPRLVLGMLLGYMFFYTRSIWTSIIMHFINNAIIVVLYYLNNLGLTDIDVETIGRTDNFFVLAGSVILMIISFIITVNCYKKYDNETVIYDR